MKRTAPMKRTAFKRKAPPLTARGREILAGTAPKIRLASAFDGVPPAPRAVMAANMAAEPPRADPKPEPFRSEAWLAAVRQIPCVHCGGAVQAAHRNEGKGLGTKADDCLAAALCPPEHARIDSGKDLARDERRALMDRYIVLTLRGLVRRGLVGVVA